MAKGRDVSQASTRFPSHVENMEGVWRRVRTVKCSKCGYPATLSEKPGVSLPEVAVAKKFVQRGWRLNGCNVCPRCQQGKPPMSPAARRAAFLAINGARSSAPHTRKAAPMPDVKAAPMADPPPISTLEERRCIRDALDEHYDEGAGRYRSSFSDKALAAKLNVPVKWVRDLREAMGFGPDANEATAIRAADIAALRGDLSKLQTDLLERFDALERRVKKLLPEGL